MAKKKSSTSRLRLAPPTITWYTFPPNISRTLSHMRSFTLSRNKGMFINRRTLLVWNLGNIFLRTIFSITKGTEQIIRGCISARASATNDGLGVRVRKYMWLPKQNWKRKSAIKPYIWAMGRKLTQLLFLGICFSISPFKLSKLLHSVRNGSITPLENPVVPLV